MAVPTLAASDDSGALASASTQSHTIPAGWSAGDLVLAVLRTGTRTISSRPSGWANVNGATGIGDNVYVEWKILASGDLGASQSWTLNASASARITFLRITGAHATTPIDTSAQQNDASSGTSHISPAVTTTADDCLIVRSLANGGQATSASSGDTGSKFFEATASPGTSVWQSSKATAGSTGTATYTTGASRQLGHVVVAVAPAASSAVTATLTATLGDFTLSGSATAATPTGSDASLTSTLGSVTLTGSATSAAPGASTGSLTATLGAVTLTGSATSAAPAASNSTLSSTLGSVTLTGSATAGAAGAVTGTLDATLAAFTLSGAATSAAPGNTTGTLSATLGSATLSGVVTISVAGTTATLSSTLGSVTLSGAATSVTPTGTTASLNAAIASVTLVGVSGALLFVGPTRFDSIGVRRGTTTAYATGTRRGPDSSQARGEPS